LKIKATLSRVALFVIVSVMLILAQNSSEVASHSLVLTGSDAKLIQAMPTGFVGLVLGAAQRTANFTVARPDVDLHS
jgi:hypothetical protein